jgi:hypothetical protein
MARPLALGALGLALVTVACGGSNTAPSGIGGGSSTGFLAGSWNGTLTISSPIGDVTAPVTVVFVTIPNTSGTTYNATITSTNAALPISNTGPATALPTFPPATFTLDQSYPSTHGNCRGSFNANGQVVTTNHIDANVFGIESCPDWTYSGHLTLDRR